ncbi:Spy/CpxP family protein refolding chaperone [Marinobacterium halophilum]|uniref:Spy/CpxP family protein refolding chaperone n=1 Tax=Marinobacterium halophilum TaxID=267374 RepID=A0A2P8ESV6_9GAMM|nr:Spy/CpxP family protein refolding chaperone [Marinobacterium halophilum]PSL12518.1 Spy/CpxP family protein refolding chaperone [Marinobacterium halophilum]
MNMHIRPSHWLAITLGLGLAATAQAQHHMNATGPAHTHGHMQQYGPMMGYGMGMMPCPMMGGWQGGPGVGLQLDEAQQKKMNKIQEKFWKLQREQMEEMQEHHVEMQELWRDGTPDSGKVMDLHREMHEEQLELLEERLKLQQEMDHILTEEQRQQLRQMHPGRYPSDQ